MTPGPLPPSTAEWFLRWMVGGDDEFIEDLREQFAERAVSSVWRARQWYWRQVFHPNVLHLGRALRHRRHRLTPPSLRVRDGHRRSQAMSEIPREFRFAVRSVRRNPGFAAVVVVTLALGIGATTGMFSLIRAVVLSDLPYAQPDRIAYVWETFRQWDQIAASPANVREWRERIEGFETLAASRPIGFNLSSVEPAIRVTGARVTADYLDVYGVPPRVGRGFSPGDDLPGAPPVAILSYGLWQRLSGGDPGFVGEQITVDAESYTVVGVMPREFTIHQPGPEDIWIPGVLNRPEAADTAVSFRWHWLRAVGRLEAGVTIDGALASARTVAEQLAVDYPRSNEGWGVNMVPARTQIVGDADRQLYLLTGAVTFLLLIAVFNIAHLLLAKLSAQRREFTVRLALGGSRIRILREVAIEMLVLSLGGAILGTTAALLLVPSLLQINPGVLRMVGEVRLDVGLGVFVALISIITALAVSIIPVWRLGRGSGGDILRTGNRGGIRRGESRLRTALVAVESALATVLVAGAALMIASMLELLEIDPGFDPAGRVTFEVNAPESRYTTAAETDRLMRSIADRMRAQPGVAAAGFTTGLPFTGNNLVFPVHVQGQPGVPGAAPHLEGIGPGYFDALGLDVRVGRGITAADAPETQRVVVINEALRERYFEDRDPMGALISSQDSLMGPWMTVVGVVPNIRHTALRAPVAPTMYVPVGQMTFNSPRVDVLLAPASGDLLSHVAEFRAAVAEIDADIPVTDPRTFEDIVSGSLSRTRFQTVLLMVFGGLGLTLGAVGIYGVVAFGVSQRMREMGLRIALGARAARVRTLVTRQGVSPVIAGTLIGLLAAAGLTRFIASWLFGVAPTDPVTYGVVAGVMVLTGFVSAWVPAQRATRADPVVTLRNE